MSEIVLLDFYADWCGPCKVFSPVIERVAEDMGIALIKINVDRNPDKAEQFGVYSIPTTVLLVDGKEKARLVGAVPEVHLREWIRQNIE